MSELCYSTSVLLTTVKCTFLLGIRTWLWTDRFVSAATVRASLPHCVKLAFESSVTLASTFKNDENLVSNTQCHVYSHGVAFQPRQLTASRQYSVLAIPVVGRRYTLYPRKNLSRIGGGSRLNQRYKIPRVAEDAAVFTILLFTLLSFLWKLNNESLKMF